MKKDEKTKKEYDLLNAARIGDLRGVKAAIDGADVNVRDTATNSPVASLAIVDRQCGIAEMLVRKGADTGQSAINNLGLTPTDYAKRNCRQVYNLIKDMKERKQQRASKKETKGKGVSFS